MTQGEKQDFALHDRSSRHGRYVPYILISCGVLALAAGMLCVSGIQMRGGVVRPRPSDALFSARRSGIPALPRTMLWAWERPEDLNFIDPRETGVAFLAETINIFNAGERFGVMPRRQPLRVPEGTSLVAVARIEMRSASAPKEADAPAIAAEIARLAEIRGVVGIQIDFDATVSQREFYAAILRDLRKQIPNEMPISITALASWCFGDAWLDALPIDEAVPMLFRMGVDDRNIRFRLARGDDFASPVCRSSEGISTDEVAPELSGAGISGRRVYLFHPRSWTAAAFHEAAKGAGQ
ncbi:MAG TPA: DUF3142 domain-containing protein [Candidatus Acidoferrales bacterium]